MNNTEISCPICGNKLMFAYQNAKGEIEHKCKVCKHIIVVDLTTHKTRALGA
jgi:hypothetical protein